MPQVTLKVECVQRCKPSTTSRTSTFKPEIQHFDIETQTCHLQSCWVSNSVELQQRPHGAMAPDAFYDIVCAFTNQDYTAPTCVIDQFEAKTNNVDSLGSHGTINRPVKLLDSSMWPNMT